ncbi:AAA family ATPase [Desulfococcaceae bacterium HSG7]|nr:AAA family ATPase [Desulfococcaceae bacterium HSG7]
MLQRLYVHNFRCLENFELNIGNLPSALLIGKNGAGKSTIGIALEILQSIGRGTNRVRQLVQAKDFMHERYDIPMRFEVEVTIHAKLYKYSLAFELPENFKELRILDEQLSVSGKPIYSRNNALVTLHSGSQNYESKFKVDWHLVALPVIQMQSETDHLQIFKTWLAQMIILSPIPSLMEGESKDETLEPERNGKNFGDWFSGLLVRYPAAYMDVDKYLREVMHDYKDFQNKLAGKDFKTMRVRFQANTAYISIDFEDLSDGEKCFFLCAVVLAANIAYGPLFIFWDEPDNYLSLSEVGHLLIKLRRSFESKGQLLATSHNSEAIRKFSNESTFVIYRKHHLEPTLARRLNEIPFEGDLINALICDDLEL